ncbi:MAG: ABC transporter ATP-binding protein [Chloroflexi bacterium]|nr:ABC transporter ATP-binding protein [Chloroflexota bacterium]
MALLGPNGAGKTTTLQAIMGLVPLSSGTILFQGKSLSASPTHVVTGLGISLVPQDLSLFVNMSVRDNLLLGAYTVRDKRRVKRSMQAVMDLFPVLAARQRQMVGTLSGGERQMLALGRCLMSEPSMLLVDEPSLGLAPKLVIAVLDTLKRLNQQGATILLVEQNVKTTLRYASRAYVLEQGYVTLQGDSDDLLRHEHIQHSYLGTSRGLVPDTSKEI